MADLAIMVASVGPGTGGTLKITGIAGVSGSDMFSWETEVAFNAVAATITAAIKDAAIAAAVAESYTVGALDKKTLFGGAAGL